jgi:hypothetical protein
MTVWIFLTEMTFHLINEVRPRISLFFGPDFEDITHNEVIEEDEE